jgi:hypothetical protein
MPATLTLTHQKQLFSQLNNLDSLVWLERKYIISLGLEQNPMHIGGICPRRD